MEQERSLGGLQKYEPLLKVICARIVGEIDEPPKNEWYHDLCEREWQGCLAIACAISVIEGVPSNIPALSKHLGIFKYDRHFNHAFDRLKVNGIFSNKYNIRRDPALTNKAKSTEWLKAEEIERNAWCNIAAIGGGYLGLRERNLEENAEKSLKSENPDNIIDI